MIYCSFEPGLFILQGLAQYETNKAFSVIRSLFCHKEMLEQDQQIQIPMTGEYLARVYSALNNIPITNPPVGSEFRGYVIAVLAKMCEPLIIRAGFEGIIITPDFTSEWIDDETKQIWLDSLTAAMIEAHPNDRIELTAATWLRQNIPNIIHVSHPTLWEQLEVPNHNLDIPVLADELDWNELFCFRKGWPTGLDSTLIDCYAKRYLGVPPERLGGKRKIDFIPSCKRDIFRESDTDLRNRIIEVIACRAYNCVRPEHHDENIAGQPGVRRVYVRQMAPPVRLHYIMDAETITYILYSNGDHDRGL